jgi:FkbH-like protein
MTTVADRLPFAQVEHFEALAHRSSKPIKCVIWDLDDTLWQGTLAEGDDVVLKPGIREILATLDSRGILHSIASRNNHADVQRKLEELALDHYFLYPQIGWNPKSASIAKIQKDLNLGMDSLLFIDDQAFERDEVASACPSVNCMPAELYESVVYDPRLNPRVVTEDAHRRRLLYLEDIRRKQDEEDYQGPREDFLASLDMQFLISRAKTADLVRAEELTLRTNQLNSTGITYDRAELEAYMHSERHSLLICELTDKYGSYGKIGLALIEHTAEHDHIRLLLMSCRTVSRGLGSVLLYYLMKEAARKRKQLRADFLRTERNRQMLVTYQFANFRIVSRDESGAILFENDLSTIQDYPPYIEVRAE